MKFHRTVLLIMIGAGLPGYALTAADQEDPALTCYRSAASGSREPFACDLAIQVATRSSDSRSIAAAYTNRGLVLARAGRLELALKDHNEAVTRLPGNPSVLINRADVLMRMGRPADALADYDRAAAADPDAPAVFFNRAFTHRAMGNLAAAETDIAQARALLAAGLR